MIQEKKIYVWLTSKFEAFSVTNHLKIVDGSFDDVAELFESAKKRCEEQYVFDVDDAIDINTYILDKDDEIILCELSKIGVGFSSADLKGFHHNDWKKFKSVDETKKYLDSRRFLGKTMFFNRKKALMVWDRDIAEKEFDKTQEYVVLYENKTLVEIHRYWKDGIFGVDGIKEWFANNANNLNCIEFYAFRKRSSFELMEYELEPDEEVFVCIQHEKRWNKFNSFASAQKYISSIPKKNMLFVFTSQDCKLHEKKHE